MNNGGLKLFSPEVPLDLTYGSMEQMFKILILMIFRVTLLMYFMIPGSRSHCVICKNSEVSKGRVNRILPLFLFIHEHSLLKSWEIP